MVKPRRRSGSSIVVLDSEDLKPCLPDVYNNLPHLRQTTNEEDTQEIDQELYTTMLKSINQDNGPHREMAVDCPDNFIARNKTPPRYPPPRPPQSQKLNNALSLKGKTLPLTPNPNGNAGVGSLASTPDDLELMVDTLYRKGSSSHSSSFECEVLSKKSGESYDSISYRQLTNNNNNHLNNKASPTQHPNNATITTTTTSSSTSSSSLHNKSNGLSAEVLNGCLNNGSGDSLTSITSSSSTPPPEYELKEFSSKSSILPPL
ncbi:uncharacterized protein DDB_G0271670-like, partial [Lucilia cuprina]|uniref:uncharacterized protein DDB_G0271670-like n=1 Tax=Lucilia cuprina TaxID=7375 RepID=UPI001F063FAC